MGATLMKPDGGPPEEKNYLPPGDELQLRVYDKLWENIIHKENRLWTFLAIYGAAVGFIVSQDLAELGDFRYAAYFTLLLLTYWAAEIIIDSDWWSVRNRVMIRGIEKRHETALKGVIPSFYNSIGYRGESIHGASIVVVCIVGLVAYLIGINAVFSADKKVQAAIWAPLLYLFAGLAVMRCLHMRESRLREYYVTLRDLLKEEVGVKEGDIAAQEVADRIYFKWRPWTMLLYLLLTVPVGSRAWSDMDQTMAGAFITAQLLLVIAFLSQQNPYLTVRPDCVGFNLRLPRKTGDGSSSEVKAYVYRNRFMLLMFLVSGAILGSSVGGLRL
jgi:hypothetical protein